MARTKRTERVEQSLWADRLNLILGAWLLIAPFIGLGDAVAVAAWNSWIVGAVVIAVALIGLNQPRPWEEAVNLVAGVWIFFAPFLFGYSNFAEAAWNQILVGGAIATIAIIGLAYRREQRPGEPTGAE